MTNQPLRRVQMMLIRFIDSRKKFQRTNATFVGELKYAQVGDPLKKLLAKLEHLKRQDQFTATQHKQAQQIKAAIVSLSRRPARSKSRHAAA